MNGKYAIYIWSSYGLALLVLVWNLLVPQLRRRALQRRMAEPADEEVG